MLFYSIQIKYVTTQIINKQCRYEIIRIEYNTEIRLAGLYLLIGKGLKTVSFFIKLHNLVITVHMSGQSRTR